MYDVIIKGHVVFDDNLGTNKYFEINLSGKYPQIANILIKNEIMQPIECVDVALLNIKFEIFINSFFKRFNFFCIVFSLKV